jgi:hypothetical protein
MSTTAHAQTLKGSVADATNAEPLAFANILVIDNEPGVTGTVTNTEGCFELACTARQLRVKVSYLGYVTKDTLLTCDAFNAISLTPDAEMLGEVVVTGQRKLFKLENGGISTDVANSSLKNIGNAGDVLEQIPFVVKNGDDVSVMGKKGAPLIYINNRLVRNNNELERLSSGNIKKITVITNPGPEYDAGVTSVIRIEATRPQGEGFGGEVYGRLNARRELSKDASVDLNYRHNNLDVFGSYWYQESRSRSPLLFSQTMFLPDKTISEEEDNTGRQRFVWRWHTAEGGFNYSFNDRHAIGAKYTFRDTDGNSFFRHNGVFTITPSTEAPEPMTTSSAFHLPEHSHLVSAYYTGDIAPWLKAQLDADYSTGDRTTFQNSLTGRPSGEENVNTTSTQDYNLWAGKLTLTTPVWGSELRYGVELSNTSNTEGYLVNAKEGADDLTSSVTLTKQQTTAAFLSFNKSLNKQWSVNLGLRYEHVGYDYYEDDVRKEEQSRTYNDLFPMATLNWEGEKVQMSLGYRATIDRPSYYQLRNSIQYNNPYNYERGNPYLQPIRTDGLTYTLMWNKLKVMASYDMYRDYIIFASRVWGDGGDKMMFTPENVKRSQNVNLSVNYAPTFGLWSPSATLGISRDFITLGDYKPTRPYVNYSWLNTFTLPADFIFRADVIGNFRGQTMETTMLSSFRVDARITKTLLKGNLILNLIARDVFNTYKSAWKQRIFSVYSYRYTDDDMRCLQLSVRYKFNTSRSKYKGESASQAERSRL